MLSLRYKLSVFSVGLLVTFPAYAYLDPGTGSVLLQGLLAGFAGVVAVIKIYWVQLKQWVRSHRKK